MNKNKAMKIIYDQYEKIKQKVYDIEVKYFHKKGIYHEDITHDMFLKIYLELEKIENRPDQILKFIDRIINGQLSYIYTIAKNTYLNFLKREKKYTSLNYKAMNENERKKLVEMPETYQEFDDDDIQQKVDDYVKTFYWFDQKLFDLYRYEFKMHKTEMSKKTNISYSTIYRTVKRCKVKIKDKLKGDYYE